MKKGIDYTGITVVFLCHDGNGRFIMAKRSNQCRDEGDKWDVGADSLDFDEQVERALHREIKEEYCTDVINSSYLGFRDVHRINEGHKTHWLALDHLVQVSKDQVAIGEPHKIVELKWFNLENMPDAISSHSQLPIFWKKYKDELKNQLQVPVDRVN